MTVCVLLTQESVSQTTAQTMSRSRSSFSRMLPPSWCPVRSHHWSVAQIAPRSHGRDGQIPARQATFKAVHVFQVKDCLDHSALPMDGATLTEALHQRGINVRYLGSVLEFVDKTPAKAQLEHFYVSLNTTTGVAKALPVL